jgi:hypothetical protein
MLPALGPLLGVLAAGLIPFVYLTTRSATRRAIGAATAMVLAAAVSGLRHGQIPEAIAGSREPVATAAALVAAAPHSLVYEVPAVAFAAVVLPWVLRHARPLARRASEARTYTG